MRKWILLSAIISSVISCATPTIPVLPLPERPLRPVVTQAELACVPDDAYQRLVRRELIYDAHITTLEAIIKRTH